MKAKKRVTFFIDADDTLWRDNAYYEQATKALYREVVIGASPTYDQFVQKLNKIETIRCKKLRQYSEKAFIQSLKILCKEYHTHMDERVQGMLYTILEQRQKPKLYPHVAKTLRALQKKHGDLYLYTKGKRIDYVQKLKITELYPFFRGVISCRKSASSFKKILKKLHIQPSEALVIGDSYANDVLPALANRVKAIYISNTEAWTPENPKTISKKIAKVSFFYQTITLISSYGTTRTVNP